MFPYEIKYFLNCPICKYGIVLDKKQLEELKPIAEANQLLISGEITPEEHHARINQLSDCPTDAREAEYVEKPALPSGADGGGYCAYCGNQVSEDSKFCGHCGHPIISS